MPDPRMQTNDMIENPHMPPSMDQRDRTYDPSHVMGRRDGGIFGPGTIHDEHGGQAPPEASPFQPMNNGIWPGMRPEQFHAAGQGAITDMERAMMERQRMMGGQGQMTDQDVPFMRSSPME